MNSSIPKRCHKIGHLNLAQNIKHLITQRNITKIQCQRRRNPNLLTKSKLLQKQIDFQISCLRNKTFNSKLQSLDHGSKQFWRFTKLIKNSNSSTNMPPLKTNSNQFVYTNSEKAKEIAKMLSTSHLLTANMNHSRTSTLVDQSINTINNSPISINDTTPLLTKPLEIKKFIHLFKSKKSPGIDGITNLVRKTFPFKSIIHLTKILNACILLCYFPQPWKIAKVIAILKTNKDPLEPTSYRPISLLCSLTEILERILLKRLNLHIDAK